MIFHYIKKAARKRKGEEEEEKRKERNIMTCLKTLLENSSMFFLNRE